MKKWFLLGNVLKFSHKISELIVFNAKVSICCGKWINFTDTTNYHIDWLELMLTRRIDSI